MDNPFLKRATEFFRDEEAFLAILSPEPIRSFLTREGRQSVLYDKLVLIRGTPGSGKTTLARVFEYPTSRMLRAPLCLKCGSLWVAAVPRHQGSASWRASS